MKISVVVPTNNPLKMDVFIQIWREIFKKHCVALFTVADVERPFVEYKSFGYPLHFFTPDFLLDRRLAELISFKTDAVRNAGFIEAVKAGADVIITLDDDVLPDGNDPIQEHLDALGKSYPTSWFNPFDGAYMRGFPYGVRSESKAVVSHGIWSGIQDFDAPTTLVRGTASVPNTYRGAVPKGALTPVCGMNLAFLREAAPYVYFAPMAGSTGFHRFGDIWMGINLKRALDKANLALVHGYSRVRHERQSNMFSNLAKEAAGIVANETQWAGGGDAAYNAMYDYKREKWEILISAL